MTAFGLCGISILAGGMSTRMGQDKIRMRLGPRTMLAHIRAGVRPLKLTIRLIRKDLVPRCGPLSGVYTALKTSRAEAELFLACDMPFVPSDLLTQLLERYDAEPQPLFVTLQGRVGFPFLLPVKSLPQVEERLARNDFSLQKLAAVLKAKRFRPSRKQADSLFNVNTPDDWELARDYLKRHRAASGTIRHSHGEE